MLPLAPIVVRIGWFALGAAAGIIAKSNLGKEAVEMFKDGIKSMGEDYLKDMSDKQKKDLAEKEQLVKNIRKGQQ